MYKFLHMVTAVVQHKLEVQCHNIILYYSYI